MKKNKKQKTKITVKSVKPRLSVAYNHSDKVIWVFLVLTIIAGILYWIIWG